MNILRDGHFDVILAAGPSLRNWPSIGVQNLSLRCSEAGLKVGLFGGDDLIVRGVLPGLGIPANRNFLSGTGGIVIVEDSQRRIHRLTARAVVKVRQSSCYPLPFLGWRSAGMVSLWTAKELLRQSSNSSMFRWEPAVAVLGSGNKALRFASELLEKKNVGDVFCIEPLAQWGHKRYSGWEVEMRRFKIYGGRFLEAEPISLAQTQPSLWDFTILSNKALQKLKVSRVVSVGPFREISGLSEYPESSLLFEVDQTSETLSELDIEGWNLEVERFRWLGGNIIKSLLHEVSTERKRIVREFRLTKSRLRRFYSHRTQAFAPLYQGKWLHNSDLKKLREFEGVPKRMHGTGSVASIECFEEINCRFCVDSCPEQAISLLKAKSSGLQVPHFKESACTGCGKCLVACPSKAIVMLKNGKDQSQTILSVVGMEDSTWTQGSFLELVNRNGEKLGSGRLSGVQDVGSRKLLHIKIPNHLMWECRGVREGVQNSHSVDPEMKWVEQYAAQTKKIEILFNGEKKWVREGISLAMALFELGKERAGDLELCNDGSCNLCEIQVDGKKKLACETKTRKGASILTKSEAQWKLSVKEDFLCPCLGITVSEVKERVKSGKISSAQAVISTTHVGGGQCRGLICLGPFKHLLLDLGLEVETWVDWKFPWSQWLLKSSLFD